MSLFKEGRYVLLLNITDRMFSFIFLLLFARNFSLDTYGEVITLLTLSTVFITIFDFGLPVFMQREIAINPENKSEIFSRVFTLSLVIFVIYIISSILYFKFFYSDLSTILFLTISLFIYLSFLVTLSNKALSGLNEFKNQFISFAVSRVLIIAFLIIFIFYLPSGINFLIFGMSIGILINLFHTSLYLYKAGIKISFKYFSFSNSKMILKYSLPLGLAVIFNFLYDKIDILLISKLRDLTEVAFYNVGYGVFKASSLSFSFLLVGGFTKVSSIHKDMKAVENFLKEHFKIIFFICLIISAVLYFFSEFIITGIYTEKFIVSSTVLKILSVAVIAMGLNNLTGIILNGMGYFKIVMYITLYALIMNIILNIVLIPEYGINAAAVVTVLTEYFIFFTEFYYLRKILAA